MGDFVQVNVSNSQNDVVSFEKRFPRDVKIAELKVSFAADKQIVFDRGGKKKTRECLLANAMTHQSIQINIQIWFSIK